MQNLSLTELQPLILEWAKERNILFPENAPKQRLKLIEESGELASAILKNDVNLQKDAIGDIFVVLVILSEQTSVNIYLDLTRNTVILDESIDYNLGSICFKNPSKPESLETEIYILHDLSRLLNLDLTECANIAWNEIKDRKGKTVNGTFIKD